MQNSTNQEMTESACSNVGHICQFLGLSLSFISFEPFRITWSDRNCSPQLRHQNELIVRAWEKAVQGLGKDVWRTSIVVGICPSCQSMDDAKISEII